MMIDALQWFTGKSLEKARAAIEGLQSSLELGYWNVKGGERSILAALNKGNVAQKWARANQNALENFGVPEGLNRWGYKVSGDGDADEQVAAVASMGWEIQHCMYFGSFKRMQEIDFNALYKAARNKEEMTLAVTGHKYAKSFAEIAAAIEKLNATIPPPVFTSLGVSPTITRTWEELGAEKVIVCPMRFEQRERFDKKLNKMVTYTVCILLWPEGTRHGCSKFSMNNGQCESCGHSIRNSFNWVPLVIYTKNGQPKSLWVGRDCAKSLFGIDMKGDLEIAK